MKRVILESPFAGDFARNKVYLQLCICWCLAHDLAPFASHQMYTEALDDTNPAERTLGITAGFAWWDAAEEILFFTDFGMSPGMWKAYERCVATQKPYSYIHLAEQPDAPTDLDDFLSRLHGDPKPGS